MVEPAHSLIVSVHDVAPPTLASCERLVRAIDAVADIPLTLLVVPDYHRRGLAAATSRYRAWLETRAARGDELVLHGWTHLDEAPLGLNPLARFRRTRLTDREGEFSALCAAAARERLEAGLAWFDRQGWPVAGFVAPAWQLSAGAWQALQSTPLLYTTTRTRIYLLRSNRSLETCTFVYSTRSPLRSRMSRWVNGARQRLEAHRMPVRLALHPPDADDPAVRGQWQTLLYRLARERLAVTKAEAILMLAKSRPATVRALRAPG